MKMYLCCNQMQICFNHNNLVISEEKENEGYGRLMLTKGKELDGWFIDYCPFCGLKVKINSDVKIGTKYETKKEGL